MNRNSLIVVLSTLAVLAMPPAANGDGLESFVQPIVTGAGKGANGQVRVFYSSVGAPAMDFYPYGISFRGGVRVAAGDVNGDHISDIVTAPASGNNRPLMVFDGETNKEIYETLPKGKRKGKGLYPAIGDVDGDRKNEIVVGEGPRLLVLEGSNGKKENVFNPFNSRSGDVHPAVGNVDSDSSSAEIVAALGARFAVFSGVSGDLQGGIMRYKSYGGGIYPAVGDLEGEARDELFIPQRGRVIVVDSIGYRITTFSPYNTPKGKIFMAAGNVDGDEYDNDELVVAPGPGSNKPVIILDQASSSSLLTQFYPYGSSFNKGVSVAVGR